MSGAVITATAQGVEDVPAKLRVLAASSATVLLRLTADDARALALWIDRGFAADRAMLDAVDALEASRRAQNDAFQALDRARQHVAQAEMLGRLWAVLAIAACAVAGVILLLRA
jgi:hypothetical protein